jgi:hypothetical protein
LFFIFILSRLQTAGIVICQPAASHPPCVIKVHPQISTFASTVIYRTVKPVKQIYKIRVFKDWTTLLTIHHYKKWEKGNSQARCMIMLKSLALVSMETSDFRAIFLQSVMLSSTGALKKNIRNQSSTNIQNANFVTLV